MILEEQIKTRIAELRAQLVELQRQEFGYLAAIGELEKLLQPAPQPEPGKPVE